MSQPHHYGHPPLLPPTNSRGYCSRPWACCCMVNPDPSPYPCSRVVRASGLPLREQRAVGLCRALRQMAQNPALNLKAWLLQAGSLLLREQRAVHLRHALRQVAHEPGVPLDLRHGDALAGLGNQDLPEQAATPQQRSLQCCMGGCGAGCCKPVWRLLGTCQAAGHGHSKEAHGVPLK